ncbi:hypothetical protein GN958_ATG21057 [Phytophthora infestans]|uniref:Uncharacterized protein n=1 Tax=Phytophthora infestans TaxID=4787 RepID=A0A8S9TT87_PHYIN|nr:hypothetical protein GN958_ATG21057 [Phytophthora infestans]
MIGGHGAVAVAAYRGARLHGSSRRAVPSVQTVSAAKYEITMSCEELDVLTLREETVLTVRTVELEKSSTRSYSMHIPKRKRKRQMEGQDRMLFMSWKAAPLRTAPPPLQYQAPVQLPSLSTQAVTVSEVKLPVAHSLIEEPVEVSLAPSTQPWLTAAQPGQGFQRSSDNDRNAQRDQGISEEAERETGCASRSTSGFKTGGHFAWWGGLGEDFDGYYSEGMYPL